MEGHTIMIFSYIYGLLSFAGNGVICVTPPSLSHLLFEHLMVNQSYNKKIRPSENAFEPTLVNISLTVMNILEFNELTEQLSIAGKLTLTWKDEYLYWDKSLFGGLDSISIPQNDVWKPDIALENSVSGHGDLGASSMNVLVTSSGEVTWKPMQVFQSNCIADVTKFPLDTQTCCLNFEAWSHRKSDVAIRNGIDIVELHGYDGQPEWAIDNTSAETELVKGDVYVRFCITLKRKALYFFLNIILPISLLSGLSSCVFLLPVACGEKASFAVTVFLSMTVFLTIVSQQLPKASDNVAVFNVFVFAQVLNSTLITIATLFQLRLYYNDRKCNVPSWLRQKVTGEKKVSPAKDNPNDDEENSNEDKPAIMYPSDDWKCVAEWLDPVLFVAFTVVNGIFTLSLMMWSYSR